MPNLILFIVGTLFLGTFSRNSLLRYKSHGFYRFFAWEVLLILLISNLDGWFANPFAWHQLVSWLLLILSLALVILGLRLLRTIGRSDAERNDPALLSLEKTSRLVTAGLYGYIRHPMYASLLFLGWGIFFKSPSWLDGGLALLCTMFLYITARIEERENQAYFGEEYAAYMSHSRMFIPFIF